MRADPNTTTVLRTPQSRSAYSAFAYSMPKRKGRISSRNRNSWSSTASRKDRDRFCAPLSGMRSFPPMGSAAVREYS